MDCKPPDVGCWVDPVQSTSAFNVQSMILLIFLGLMTEWHSLAMGFQLCAIL